MTFDELHKIISDKFGDDLNATKRQFQRRLETKDQEKGAMQEKIE